MTASRSSSRRRPSEEERAQKRAAERELMAAAIEQLRSSEGWQRWLSVRHRFHTYSLHNQLLIAHQRPGATYVAGFRRWLALGYAVRKGERGIRIWAPCAPSPRKLAEWRQAGADPQKKPRTFFRLVAVFDRSQVDPLPEFPGGPLDLDPPLQPIAGEGLAHLFEPLAAFGASIDFPVVVEPIPGSAQGLCDPGGKITVEPVSEEFSPNAQIATEIHELAHALVRCERQEEDPKLTYAEEEVVVECVAYTVCSTVGLDTAGFSVPYLASWSEGGEIERYAALIDRLAARLEEVALGSLKRDGDEEAAPTQPVDPATALAA
ncbi:MAG TPA: ArdC-like ssDNA-binding domain-containing protein [Solirubrobacterales bacterium]|nr:ArdC-like ssDNA-binding domain-containing protein [Solirubrobacterales bacterium]